MRKGRRKHKNVIGAWLSLICLVAGYAGYLFTEISFANEKSSFVAELAAKQQASYKNGGLLLNTESGTSLGAKGIVQRLSIDPLNQDLAALYFWSVLFRNGPAVDASNFARVLDLMGRRSSNAQSALIQFGLQQNDVTLVFEQIDELLRREKRSDQIMPLLFQLEGDTRGRAILAERLANEAPWRRKYLQEPKGLETASSVQNRRLLINQLAARGSAIERNDLQPLVLRMVQIGQVAEAYELWCRYAAQCQNAVFDAHFAQLEERQQSSRPELYPFEWNVRSGSGYSATVVSDQGTGGDSGLLLRWNGRGEPTLVQQIGRVSAISDVLITVKDAPKFAKAFKLELRCVGQRESTVIRMQQIGNFKGATLRYSASMSPNCAFGSLAIVGNPLGGGDAPRIRIDRIQTFANR